LLKVLLCLPSSYGITQKAGTKRWKKITGKGKDEKVEKKREWEDEDAALAYLRQDSLYNSLHSRTTSSLEELEIGAA
jgi:hypothetical protein